MAAALIGLMPGDAESGIVAYFFNVKTSIILGGVLTVLGTIILALLLPKFVACDGREGIKRKEREEAERNDLQIAK